MYPERFDSGEAKQLERALDRADGGPRRAVRAALSEHRRARSQRDQLQRLEKAVTLADHDPPFIFKPRLDVPDLERLAAEV